MSITEFYSDSIFTVNQCGFIGYCDDENKVYIGDTSLQNHILKHINPTRNRKIITCVSEACITSIFSLVWLQLMATKTNVQVWEIVSKWWTNKASKKN